MANTRAKPRKRIKMRTEEQRIEKEKALDTLSRSCGDLPWTGMAEVLIGIAEIIQDRGRNSCCSFGEKDLIGEAVKLLMQASAKLEDVGQTLE